MILKAQRHTDERGRIIWTVTAKSRTEGNSYRTACGTGRTVWLAVADTIENIREAGWLETWEALADVESKLPMPVIRRFVRDSNALAGMLRAPYEAEVIATALFLSIDDLQVEHVETLAHALLSNNTTVSTEALWAVGDIVGSVKSGGQPHRVYQSFMETEPFACDNGRLARALWAWTTLARGGTLSAGFLQTYHNQTLSHK